jgi:TonB family protein
MSANILVIEYEPRYVDRVRTALAVPGHRVEIAGDLDQAVERCARFEPQLVVMTSVLPRLKIEDAITQLRARAGLRTTPFLIVMSGYGGGDTRADAVRYGAQDILERPFSTEALLEKVGRLLDESIGPVATQAIPQDTLESIRRGVESGSEPSLTSDELFGDILSDVEIPPPPPEPEPPTTPIDVSGTLNQDAPKRSSAGRDTGNIDRTLADMLESTKSGLEAKRPRPKTPEPDVDEILSQTLAGLDIQALRKSGTATGASTSPADDALHAPEPASAVEPPLAAPAPRPEEQLTPVSASPSPQETDGATDPPPPPGEPIPSEDVPPEQDEVSAAGTQFGQYVLQEHIATGGMAEVYKARMMGMEGFQKTVAIKRILPHLSDNEDFVSMFIDEAKLAAQLNHSNILHIYDLGKIDRSHYIAMEYIEGHDLRRILATCRERGVVMPVALAVHVASLLASALDYAHKKRDFENRELGLVHRDVSPQNVLISESGDVKLCDFGIAKAASKASHTRAGALKGKLQYMSPEQAWGKDIDHRSDLFSLGVVLYEMLTSQPVFSGDSELSILEQVRNPQVTPPSTRSPEVTAEIDRIVCRALEADRDARYQSARELQRDLERVMRASGWALDTSAVATFVTELEAGLPITPIARSTEPIDIAADGPPAGAPPTSPPPATPDGDEPTPPVPADEPVDDGAPPPEPIVAEETPIATSGGGRSRLWFGVGAVALLALIAGLVWILGGLGDGDGAVESVASDGGAAVVTEPTATPTATEDDLLQRAAEIADAEVARQEADLRRRLEEEFPTPTPLPPTATPTVTPTVTPTATGTATPVPPTPTPVPPTATPVPPTPTPSVREGDIVTPGAGVSGPVVISQIEPKYPPVARNLRVSGEVEARALIGIEGAVEEVQIVSCSRPGVGFEKATEDAISEWRYKPATKNGVKVKMWVTVRVPFNFR